MTEQMKMDVDPVREIARQLGIHVYGDGLLSKIRDTIALLKDEAHNCKQFRELIEEQARASLPVGVPDGYALVPARMELLPEDIAAIMFHCGGDEDSTEVDEMFQGGVLWVGETRDDDGSTTYGLNIACVECLGEGSTPLVEFAAPAVKESLSVATPSAPAAEPAPVAALSGGVRVPRELLQDLHDLASDAVEHHRAAFAGYKLKRQANMEDVVDRARALLAPAEQGGGK